VSQPKKIKILALEPYYGGSHRAFLDNWRDRSMHDWTLLTLPATKWKWRMRHSSVTLAEQAKELISKGAHWDLILATDMLNLAEFKGLIDPDVARLPAVAYFHENQLTYPTQGDEKRDYHFAMNNLVSCLAADQVWFNSKFHRNSFVSAVDEWLTRMPDNCLPGAAETIKSRSLVMPQGYEAMPERPDRKKGPLRILWSGRWEYDKNPDCFFAALRLLKDKRVAFRLSVIGQQFSGCPAIFEHARNEFADSIDRWGYQPTRDEYVACLHEADVVVSTAQHEFFGVAAVEAIAAGARPLLPRRLAYPEILGGGDNLDPDPFLYDGTVTNLVRRLRELSAQIETTSLQDDDFVRLQSRIRRLDYDRLAPFLDNGLDEVLSGGSARNNFGSHA
jgi:glycosyltransferase involved in cell wall biosynthesis